MARIAFDRPEKRNAFRPETIDQMTEAFKDVWADDQIGVVLLTGNGPSPKDGVHAFCAGGDQGVRGHAGYMNEQGVAQLNVLELQRIMRNMPKPVIALVNGFAIGAGTCSTSSATCPWHRRTLNSARQGLSSAALTADLGHPTWPSVVGQKKAREIWYLCRRYSAQEAVEMGLVNKVLPTVEALEEEGVDWARRFFASPRSRFAFSRPASTPT